MNEKRSSVTDAELNLLDWLRALPCGHRALLESALIAASADLANASSLASLSHASPAVTQGPDTAFARIGGIQTELLTGLAERLYGLSRRESAVVGDAVPMGRVIELPRRS